MYWPDILPFEVLSFVMIKKLASRLDYFLSAMSLFLLIPLTAAIEHEVFSEDFFSNSSTSFGMFMLNPGEY